MLGGALMARCRSQVYDNPALTSLSFPQLTVIDEDLEVRAILLFGMRPHASRSGSA